MQGIEAHAVKHNESRYMVIGIVPLVQKGHPCKELNPTGN